MVKIFKSLMFFALVSASAYGADGIVVIRYEVAPPGLKLVVR